MKTLKLKTRPQHSWLRKLHQECIGEIDELKLIDCRFIPDKELVQMYFILRAKSNLKNILKSIRTAEDVVKSEIFIIEPRTALGSVTVSRCEICSTIAKSGCHVKKAITKEGMLEWEIMGSSKNIRFIMDSLLNHNFDFLIADLENLRMNKRILTAKQEKVLRLAYELGYFDFPRRVSLKEIAEKAGSNISTVSEILRRAVKNLIKSYVLGEV